MKRYILAMTVCAAMVAGCESYNDPRSSENPATMEKLRQIETLDTESLKPKSEVTVAEANVPAEEMKITLEECRAIALEHNLSLKVQLISPAIAAQSLNAEKAKFEAVFSASGHYSKAKEIGSTTDSQDVDLGLVVPMRTGGRVLFDLVDTRTDEDGSIYGANTSFSVSQPLLKNAGTWVNTYSIRVQEYGKQISEAQTKLEIITVLAATDRVYWRLYAARRELEVRKGQYELAQQQLERVRRLVSSGTTSQVEIVRAEAGVAERLGGIITAENSLRQRKRELKRVLNKPGLDIGSRTVLVPATEPDPVHYMPDKQKLVLDATANRMEMLVQELQFIQSVESIDFYKNQTLPVLSASYTYNVGGVGEARHDAYDMMLHNKVNDNTVGLLLQVPLGNEAAKSRLAQAYLDRRQKLATKESRRALIEQEVLNAVDQLESNWQQIMAGRQNSVLSGRLYEAEDRQFRLGLRTSTDVLDAQTKFAQAQSQEISALAEYQISLVDMANATGTVLGAAKIEWSPDSDVKAAK